MKHRKLHTVRTFPNELSKWWNEEKSIPLTHKYMTAHVPVLVQALQYKVAGLN
jgi:hypothetical protein